MIEQTFDIAAWERLPEPLYRRATTYHNPLLTQLIVEGAKNPGFSVIEVITHCPTSYGRRNGMASPPRWSAGKKIMPFGTAKYLSGEVELQEDQFTSGFSTSTVLRNIRKNTRR